VRQRDLHDALPATRSLSDARRAQRRAA